MTAGRLGVVVAVVCAVTACSIGPTTQAELCAGFDRLDEQSLRGNSGIGNPLYDAVEDLGDLAADFPGDEVAADAERLYAVDDDEVTDFVELQAATEQISTLCDRPGVGLGFLLDD